jgi:hypothetical protein
MRRILWLLILELLGFVILASAQTVGPLVAEGGKGKAKGEFVVTNNGVVPMVTTVEAVQFRLTPDGKSVFSPIDSSKESVKVLESSFKVGPRQTHTVAYEVQCFVVPCTVAFLPRMVTGVRTTEGLQLGIIIPHSVYLCEKAKGCRASIRRSSGIPEGK